jgi:hypothetical protein
MESELDVQSVKIVPTLGGMLGLKLAYIVARTETGQTIEAIGTARFSEERAMDRAIDNASEAATRTDANVSISQLDTLYSTVQFTNGGYESETREGNVPRIYLSLTDGSGSVNAKQRLSFVVTLARLVAGLSIIGIPLLYVLPSPETIRSNAYFAAIDTADAQLSRIS